VKKKMSTFASKPAVGAGVGSFSLGTSSSHSCGTGSV
jgi:hypothetical protein